MNSQKRLSVYILLCSDTTYYTGVTNNVARRFEEHSEGLDENSYTYRRRPLKLVFEMSFADFNLAIHWEKRLKKWSKKKKEALINGELHLLPELSKKKNFNKK